MRRYTREEILLESPDYSEEERVVYENRSARGGPAAGHVGVLVYRFQRFLSPPQVIPDGIWGTWTDRGYEAGIDVDVGPGLRAHVLRVRTARTALGKVEFRREPRPR